MALDGFFPKDIYGMAASIFTDFTQALPILTFLLSVGASAFGTSKFFLVGPLRLLPQEAPFSGKLSMTFIATLIVNVSFVFRVYAIENIFFSSLQNYTFDPSIEKYGTLISSIEPLLSHELRIPMYFLPIVPSMAFNIFSLQRALSFKTLIKLFFAFPQYFIAPCFLPIMFEAVTADDPEQRESVFKIKVWKVGSLINAIYIIIVPQILLVLSDVLRGVTDWKFTKVKGFSEAFGYGFLEKDSLILKYPYGNVISAVVVCTLCTGGLAFLVIKIKKLFVQESDVLGFSTYDTISWKILWIREISSNHGQINSLQVNIIAIIGYD